MLAINAPRVKPYNIRAVLSIWPRPSRPTGVLSLVDLTEKPTEGPPTTDWVAELRVIVNKDITIGLPHPMD
jgi:hypothetical protein